MKDFIYRLQKLLQENNKDYLVVSLAIRQDFSIVQISDILGKQIFHFKYDFDSDLEPEEALARIIKVDLSKQK